MTANEPLVSIVIPVYNGANYLSQAIESALAQTYKHCEILVINDGSNDEGESARIAHSYTPHIRYLSQPNGGVASALNLAIKEIRGHYFCWLSHDDLYLPQKVERQMEVLAAYKNERSPLKPEVAIYSDYRIFSDKGISTDIRLPIPQDTDGFRYRLALKGGLNGCTLLIPVENLRAVGGFDERLRTTQDYAMWFRLATDLRFIHLPEVLVSARVHPQQGIYTQSKVANLECQNLHATFARELIDADLPDKLGHGLALLAKSFWERGFDEAAHVAEQRAKLHGVSSCSLTWGRCCAMIQRLAAQLLRHLLSPTRRANIRQHLQNSRLRSEP